MDFNWHLSCWGVGERLGVGEFETSGIFNNSDSDMLEVLNIEFVVAGLLGVDDRFLDLELG